jgi:hypothetical protein
MDSVARKPLEAGQQWAVHPAQSDLTDYEEHEAFMPTFPLCRPHSRYGVPVCDNDNAWDRDGERDRDKENCTKYVQTHAGEQSCRTSRPSVPLTYRVLAAAPGRVVLNFALCYAPVWSNLLCSAPSAPLCSALTPDVVLLLHRVDPWCVWPALPAWRLPGLPPHDAWRGTENAV